MPKSYKMIFHHVENQTERKHLEENSELMKELRIFECESRLKLGLRNGQEIFIPQMARRELILELLLHHHRDQQLTQFHSRLILINQLAIVQHSLPVEVPSHQ